MSQSAARHVDCVGLCLHGLCVVVVVVCCTGYGVWLVCISVMSCKGQMFVCAGKALWGFCK